MEGVIYIFLDESGDLGFDLNKKQSTRFFVVCMLITQQKRRIEKLVAQTHRQITARHKIISSTLHATHERRSTIIRFNKKMCATGCEIFTLYAHKQTLIRNRNLDDLYSSMVVQLLKQIYSHHTFYATNRIEFIASRRETSKFLNKKFLDVLAKFAEQNLSRFSVRIRTPSQKKCLQAVDFASWSVFQKIENSNNVFVRAFERIIVSIKPFKNDKAPYAISSNHPDAHV